MALSPVKAHLNDLSASPIPSSVQGFVFPLRNAGTTKTAVPSPLADQPISDSINLEEYGDYRSFNSQIIHLCMLPSTHTNTTKHRHEVLTSLLSNFTNRKDKWYWILQFILPYYTGVIVIMYEDFLIDNCGWVNWYLVGKFVKKNFYALHLFDDMSKRHNRENMSLSINLKALDIVVLVCRSWPKDLATSFTEENGTLGHPHTIKQFLCLSLLHITALTVMTISQLHCSIFTGLLLKLNQELCNRVDVHLDAVPFPNYAHEEYVPQLAQLRWDDGTVMVSQFMDELQAHGGHPFDNLGGELFWERQLHMMQLGEDYAKCMLSKFFDLTTHGNFEFQIATLLQMLKPLWNIVWFREESTPVDYIQVTSSDKFLSWVDHHFPDIYSCGSIHADFYLWFTRNVDFWPIWDSGNASMKAVSLIIYFQYMAVKRMGDFVNQFFRNELPLKGIDVERRAVIAVELKTCLFTGSLNFKIEVKLPLKKDGTSIASILLFLVYGMHFKEQWKSRTTPYVTIPEQHCVSHYVFSYVICKRWILVELELHHKKTSRRIRMLTFGSEEVIVFRLNLKVDGASVYAWLYDDECICKVCHELKVILLDNMSHINVLVAAGVISFGCCWCYFFACSSGWMSIIFVFTWSLHICLTVSVSWQNELFKFLELDTKPPYVFKCQPYTLTEVMKNMVEALGLLRSSKSSMHNIGVAYDGLKFNDFNDSERIAVFNIQDRLVPSISLFQKMEFYENKKLSGPSITDKSYEMCFHEGKMTKKDITPIQQSLLNQTARLALEDIKLRTISKAIILSNGPIVIVVALVENLLAGSLGVGPFSPFDVVACFLATSMEIEMILWVEIYEEATCNKCSLTKLWGAAITSSEVLSGSSPQVVSYLHIVIAASPASLLLQGSLVSTRSNKFFNFQP